MYHYLYDENGFFTGMTETRPEHNNWTYTPNTYSFVKEKWDGEKWNEGANEEEISEHNQLLFEQLRQEYSNKISNIKGMQEAIEKKAIDEIPIPIEIINERERLKSEFRQLTNIDYKK